ncbi:hypothetical protein N7454_004873 [Penicillium verhagenii]|nr:hypothetical protein N7454_004873 [Penicillium verhagenii]
MSNFMHKVKDAMTDHDKEADRGFRDQEAYGSSNAPTDTTNTNTNTNPSARGSNPFGSTRSGDGSGTGGTRHTRFNGDSTTTGMGTRNPADGGGVGRATNAGPHDSAVANKMDPRVDSDQDHRANQARNTGTGTGTGNTGTQRPNVTTAEGFNPSNTASLGRNQNKDQNMNQDLNQQQQQQPGRQGFDNHKSTEDSYNKSTQEHQSHSGSADQLGSEDNYNLSTQENKSHSTTSHAAPCQTAQNPNMNVGGAMGSGGIQGGQGMGQGQSGFGGNAAAGGSGVGDNSGMGQSQGLQGQGQGQNVDPMNKMDPRVTRANEQQSLAGNQRGAGY